MSMRIAVTGGIGSGKSVVCRVLEAMGYPVYDCDSRAKTIMDSDASIKSRIGAEVCRNAITAAGDIDRKCLAEAVFADEIKLKTLNSIVHYAVKRDFDAWAAAHTQRLVFVETAILYQSGLDAMVDQVWEVTCSEPVRIERVMRRNQLTREQVIARIEAQRFVPEHAHPSTMMIDNSGDQSVLLQVSMLISSASRQAGNF